MQFGKADKNSQQLGELRDLQQEILEGIASGYALQSILDRMCIRVAELAPDAICSVLLIDSEGRIRPLSAPNLPEHYSKALDGTVIGPCVGSCGTAAFLGETIEVNDIENDPLWAHFKDLALSIGLRSCWSSPIKSHEGRVIGTFAFYARTPRGATAYEREIVSACVHLCSIAIEQWEARDKIHKLAYTDALTGLGNRSALKDQLSDILKKSQRRGASVAVFYIDIDSFKAVNDLHGHTIGDQLICKVAQRLKGIATTADIIARLSGDEFLVIQCADSDTRSFETLARQINAELRGWYELERGTGAGITASIGIACFPTDGADLDALMARADTALYAVKNTGGGNFAFFDPAMEVGKHARLEMERDVKIAANQNEFYVVYQPQADVRTGDIIGFEALLRWRHPTKGNVSPAEFIPAAEACGVIGAIGTMALRAACLEAVSWPRKLKIAVNVSPAQIVNCDFAKLLDAILIETGLEPSRLEIEVTESLFIRDSDTALDTLQRLQSMGVSIAIDDFGTGYSSLSTLRSFPFDRIKIDRSFVFDMVSNRDASAIVNSVLGLGRAMGLLVVAEGVESREQLELLGLLGCNEVQGFLIGKPLPISAYAHIVGRRAHPSGSDQQGGSCVSAA